MYSKGEMKMKDKNKGYKSMPRETAMPTKTRTSKANGKRSKAKKSY